jgi:hypothetical protein
MSLGKHVMHRNECPESRISGIDHDLGKEVVLSLLFLVRQQLSGADLEPELHRECADHNGGKVRDRGEGKFYDDPYIAMLSASKSKC